MIDRGMRELGDRNYDARSWPKLGIRISDLRDAERRARRLARGDDERRASLVSTLVPLALATGLSALLTLVLLVLGT